MSPRIGALFAGYGGLEMGVQSVLGGDLAWYSEIDKGALKILTHRHPDVPNVGDVTTVDWSRAEPVDILTGGSPCQDLSHAGKRAGMTEGTRSNLWVAMREAIAQLRPGLVVWENVRGAGSAEATSDLEFCPGCMGDAWYRGTVLRALGRVVGDLADLGYVGGIHGLRAADVGAPHGRFRYILAAHPEGDPWRFGNGDGSSAADTDGRLHIAGRARADQRPVPHSDGGSVAAALLPTPATSDTNGPGAHGDGGLDLRTAVSLLPTPACTPDEWDAWADRMKAAHGNGNGHGKSLSIDAARLMPTPRASEIRTGPGAALRADSMSAPSLEQATEIAAGRLPREFSSWEELPPSWQRGTDETWGPYAAAIARWEHTLGRPAPAPTMTSTKGNPQLAPAFVEFMMGIPAGWVTDTPGITRNEALKALGNGVVPQQAEAALRFLLPALAVAA